MIIDTLATTFIIEIDQIVFSFTSNAFMKRVLEELPPVRGSKASVDRQTASEQSTVPQQWLSTMAYRLKKEQTKIGRSSRFGE
jgi:hypothetical protein